MNEIGRAARAAAQVLRSAPPAQRTEAIKGMAKNIRLHAAKILSANRVDVSNSAGVVDRLMLDEAGIESIARAVDEVAQLPDPIGEVMARWSRPNGLEISRIRTPIGVIGLIYESRPNVTADAAAICVRSSNPVILRSGSEALRTGLAIHQALVAGLESANLPASAVQFVPTADRKAVGLMLQGLSGAIDLIIPRGGKALVERVAEEARVPILGHLEGLCHTYVHASADPEMSTNIVRNAKLRRVSVCGATETLLIDRKVAPSLLPRIASALRGCELRGDEFTRSIVPMEPATEADWDAEYLAPVLAVKTVEDIDDAIAHIAHHGTGHTEAIIANDAEAAEYFLDRVDSSIVIWNASTQYADGGDFGFGAEMGIATGKLHARGPVGPQQLTSFKYQVRGNGQIRP